MDDYIKRRHLLDAIENIDWYHCNLDGKLVSGAAFEHDAFIRYDTTESVIKAIPAADVRQVVHGKWINQRADSEMCSACGVRFYISALFAVGGNDEPNYCPNCGAKMEVEHD